MSKPLVLKPSSRPGSASRVPNTRETSNLTNDILRYIQEELVLMNANGLPLGDERRLLVIKSGFSRFIETFKNYGNILSVIKREYDAAIDNLKEDIKALEPYRGKLSIVSMKASTEISLVKQEAVETIEKMEKEKLAFMNTIATLERQLLESKKMYAQMNLDILEKEKIPELPKEIHKSHDLADVEYQSKFWETEHASLKREYDLAMKELEFLRKPHIPDWKTEKDYLLFKGLNCQQVIDKLLPFYQPDDQSTLICLGTHHDVPKHLRFDGQVERKPITKSTLLSLLLDVWDAKVVSQVDLNLSEFLYSYLYKRFGDLELVKEWSYNLDYSSKVSSNRFCNVFYKVLNEDTRNEMEAFLSKLSPVQDLIGAPLLALLECDQLLELL